MRHFQFIALALLTAITLELGLIAAGAGDPGGPARTCSGGPA
jgi:hypothetical protein